MKRGGCQWQHDIWERLRVGVETQYLQDWASETWKAFERVSQQFWFWDSFLLGVWLKESLEGLYIQQGLLIKELLEGLVIKGFLVQHRMSTQAKVVMWMFFEESP